MKLADLELARIRDAMAHFNKDIKKVCEALGISRATLYRRLAAMRGG
jgi:transcriptional regulator with PAS, ATPase and Fis domain